jgi:hypothetical protein
LGEVKPCAGRKRYTGEIGKMSKPSALTSINSDVLPGSDIVLQLFEQRIFGDKLIGSSDYPVLGITKATESSIGEYFRDGRL